MEKEKIVTYLSGLDLFRGVEDEQLDSMMSDSYLASYQAGETLFYQEDPAEVFYVLLQGQIKLSQLTPEGNQITMRYLSPGEAFGIIAVLREINYPVTAEAQEDCELIAWQDENMKRWITEYPRIALNSIRILSSYVLDFQDRIKELTTERVERRIARSLLRLAAHVGEQTDDGISLEVKLTRQDIAEMSGTTLYTVSRTLNKWEASGLVNCHTAQIVIRQPHALTDIAEDVQRKD